ncbi:MAG: hypothetical protein K6T99_05420 [Armatimonadetes bacterium]|nr:hypothetical protein [Armatimonadota bacterium]
MKRIWVILLALGIIIPCRGDVVSIPDDFPKFSVPGYEKEMASIRQLFWLHYPGSGPKATLWDEWLSSPALWPAVSGSMEKMRKDWARVLSERIIDPEGYVATHQHASIAHQLGWPFPFWNQGVGTVGWHFSFKNTVGPPWRQHDLSTTSGWKLSGAEDNGISEDGWKLELTEPNASASTPSIKVDTFQSPFLQLRWSATGLGDAKPFIEWATKENPRFSADRRMYFEPVEGTAITYTMIPLYKHPKWGGEVTKLRICFGNSVPGGLVTIQAFFTQYDTRHNVNSQNFILGCSNYFHWTGDINFLRRNINRMRMALRHMMTEHHTLEKKVVYTTWVGHDGRSGLKRNADGSKEIFSGMGIGNNYWDLLPFGRMDAYATIHYYGALLAMAEIEKEITEHPEWNIPLGTLAFNSEMLIKHAEEVKETGNKIFWNSKTGRFATGPDADGKMHDYGFTFLNLEAIYYDFATPEHARSIMEWMSGRRTVKDDTAQGLDIYHWRFAPRATTKRNLDYYFWAWSSPESIPWGGQVQDGGAVLGFSYHDIMARICTLGADDAWARLKEIVKWFDEVQAAGGYRKYYDGSREGTLQGGGTAGGLGLDCEFFESVMVPQVMLDGFLGFKPTADGFKIAPKLPRDWLELTIDRIRWHDFIFTIKATHTSVEVRRISSLPACEPVVISLPGSWKASDVSGSVVKRLHDGLFEVDWRSGDAVRFEMTDSKVR